MAAATVATSGGLSAYDRARRRRSGELLPSRPTLWRWQRRRPLFWQLMQVAHWHAATVRDGLPGAAERAAVFALVCWLRAHEWKNGEMVGPVEDTPEFRVELRETLADLERELPWR